MTRKTVEHEVIDLVEASGLRVYRSNPWFKDLKTLVRIARRYGRIQEIWCSVDVSDAERLRLEAKERRMQARIEALVRPMMESGHVSELTFNGDPRGYPVKLRLKTERYNDWGGETWGIGVTQ